jgi:deoxyribodipyrimidine photo-lyase
VWCAFVFDRDILDPLPRADRRVEFIRDSLAGWMPSCAPWPRHMAWTGAGLLVRHGDATRRDRRRWPAAGRAGGLCQP